MREREFYLPSSDGCSQLHCREWIPPGNVRATVQISHGMIEHIGRYREFAEFLAERGIAVFGHDHLGHGGTADSPEKLGHFSDVNGSACVIKDVRRLAVYGAKKYSGIPHFLLGHSMGSYFVRKYISVCDSRPDGVILLGTGGQPEGIVLLGYILASYICRLRGVQFRSRLLHKLSVGSYNRKFYPAETEHDWLSRDAVMVRSYEDDEYCRFFFTGGAYRDVFRIILSLKCSERSGIIDRNLPMLFLSGDRDPVGGFGRGVRKICKRYERAAVRDMTLGFYRGARHELLNETNRMEVYEDIYGWLLSHLS